MQSRNQLARFYHIDLQKSFVPFSHWRMWYKTFLEIYRLVWNGWRVALVASLVLLLVACGPRSDPTSNGDLQIILLPPSVGVGKDIVRIQLYNREQAPITDATVTVEGNMNHAGMAPIMAGPVSDGDDGATDGIYQASLSFSMVGDWIITVLVELADGSQTTQDINVTITEGGIQSNNGTSSGEGQGTDEITVYDVVVRAVPVAGGNGAIYFTLTNKTAQADQLVAIESTVAAAAEMHESINDNNVIRMEPRPDGFELPAGGTITLAPGGKHVMLVQLAQPLVEGGTLPLTLRFAHAAPLSITATIVGLSSEIVMEHQHD